MIFAIPNVLNTAELNAIASHLANANFIDGKQTAGWYAKQVKDNQQLSNKDSQTQALRRQIKEAIRRNELFQAAVRPRCVHSLLLSRYNAGMSYGRHADNALMGKQMWRSDVSFTLFLNPPTDYEGGELVIESADDEKAYKLAAGSMLVYPSDRLHRVDPVTQGTRFVAVGWVQSLVRNRDRREILFDLDTVRRSLFATAGKTPEFDLLAKSLANLLRMWAE